MAMGHRVLPLGPGAALRGGRRKPPALPVTCQRPRPARGTVGAGAGKETP